MNYNNPHNLYKLPSYKKFMIDNLIDNTRNNYERLEPMNWLDKSIAEEYMKEKDNIRRNFINKNFGDLTSKEKDILLKNLIKAEQFSPAEKYY